MEPPYKFPEPTDVIYEEACAFRKLSPEGRFLAIVDLIASGRRLMYEAPHRSDAERWREQQEESWRRIYRELFARHGF